MKPTVVVLSRFTCQVASIVMFKNFVLRWRGGYKDNNVAMTRGAAWLAASSAHTSGKISNIGTKRRYSHSTSRDRRAGWWKFLFPIWKEQWYDLLKNNRHDHPDFNRKSVMEEARRRVGWNMIWHDDLSRVGRHIRQTGWARKWFQYVFSKLQDPIKTSNRCRNETNAAISSFCWFVALPSAGRIPSLHV